MAYRYSVTTATSQSAYSLHGSAMLQNALDMTGLRQETLGDKLRQTRSWVWNQDEGTVMGRTPRDWMWKFFLHAGFLVALIVTFAGYCGILYWQIDWNTPELINSSSILQTPGLGFRPQPFTNARLIRFVKSDGNSYQPHIDHIEAYVNYYENELQQGENYMDCSQIRGRRPDNTLHKACVFDMLQGMGSDNPCIKQQVYGFGDAQPCILLKLNKIVNWWPEEFTNDTVPAVVKKHWDEDPFSIYVDCTGDDAVSRENMGDITYFPPNGFPFKYFPFRNQQGYRSPLVFMRFESPQIGVLLMVTCRLYAKNIALDDVSESGQISFQVLVD